MVRFRLFWWLIFGNGGELGSSGCLLRLGQMEVAQIDIQFLLADVPDVLAVCDGSPRLQDMCYVVDRYPILQRLQLNVSQAVS